MGPLGDDDGAFDVVDLAPVCDDTAEASSLADETVNHDPGGAPDDVQLTYLFGIDADVEGTLEGREPELLLELLEPLAEEIDIAPIFLAAL